MVQCPALRVVKNVPLNPSHRFLVADDMFVIIALPNFIARGAAQQIDAFGGNRFERAYQTANRFVFGRGCRGGSLTAPTRTVGDDNNAV